jgi:hypothetical protein
VEDAVLLSACVCGIIGSQSSGPTCSRCVFHSSRVVRRGYLARFSPPAAGASTRRYEWPHGREQRGVSRHLTDCRFRMSRTEVSAYKVIGFFSVLVELIINDSHSAYFISLWLAIKKGRNQRPFELLIGPRVSCPTFPRKEQTTGT